jgi:hypothetical protein
MEEFFAASDRVIDSGAPKGTHELRVSLAVESFNPKPNLLLDTMGAQGV